MTELSRRFLWLTLVAAVAAGGASAHASTEQSVPQGQDPPGAENGVAVPLEPHDGVIPPPDVGDEDIETDVPNPDAGHEEEVIPPPDLPQQEPDSPPR